MSKKLTAEQKEKAIDTLLDLSGQLGVSLEEVTAMVEVLTDEVKSNPGIRGAAAGRSLKRSLLKLSQRGETP